MHIDGRLHQCNDVCMQTCTYACKCALSITGVCSIYCIVCSDSEINKLPNKHADKQTSKRQLDNYINIQNINNQLN